MWIIGGFLGLIIVLVTHIGNAGSNMKKQLANHGERIATVETGVQNLKETAHRMEDTQIRVEQKIDRLIERK
jgi:hypothetical protein